MVLKIRNLYVMKESQVLSAQDNQKDILFSVDKILSGPFGETSVRAENKENLDAADDDPDVDVDNSNSVQSPGLDFKLSDEEPFSSSSSLSSSSSSSSSLKTSVHSNELPINPGANSDQDVNENLTTSSKCSKDPVCSPGFISKGGITVELVGQELWKKFHKLGTEMIITKAGRRMFPPLKVKVKGLNSKCLYSFFLELCPYDGKRYRYVYHNSQWMVAGAGDPHPTSNIFVHGDSPSNGRLWISQGLVSFDKLKLTNNRGSLVQGQLCLHSMHRYIPKIYIQEEKVNQENDNCPECPKSGDGLRKNDALDFVFPETVFTTVTAYQNQQGTIAEIATTNAPKETVSGTVIGQSGQIMAKISNYGMVCNRSNPIRS